MLLKLCKLLHRFIFWSGIYMWWSKRYRRLYQSRYTVPLPGINPIDIVLSKLKLLKWTRDGPRELWDAVGSPHWVQHCINHRLAGHKQPEGALDCEDFAVYAAAVLPPSYDPVVLGAYWYGEEGWKGHGVCLYHLDDGAYYYIGNWGNLGPFLGPLEVLRDLLSRPAGEKALIGWARYTTDLRTIDYGTSEDTIT